METPYNIKRLSAYFDRSIDGAWVPCDIKKSEIIKIANADPTEIEIYLNKWKEMGNLRINIPYRAAKPNDYCITLIKSCPTWD